jgi:hypothetical protein
LQELTRTSRFEVRALVLGASLLTGAKAVAAQPLPDRPAGRAAPPQQGANGPAQAVGVAPGNNAPAAATGSSGATSPSGAPPVSAAPPGAPTAPPTPSTGATSADPSAPPPAATPLRSRAEAPATEPPSRPRGPQPPGPSASAGPAAAADGGARADATAPGGAPPAPPRPRGYGTPGDDDINWAVPYTRRGGFVLGLTLAGQLTGAEGTPLDYDERGDAFRVSTGTTVGTKTTIFLGGALTDWFVFKLGYSQGGATKNDYELSSAGLLLGLDVWPLFSLGGAWRDAGLSLDFGTGAATIKDRRVGKDVAEAGSYSQVRVGAFWDAARLWKINVGPAAGFEYSASETYDQTALWLGVRAAFYGAP